MRQTHIQFGEPALVLAPKEAHIEVIETLKPERNGTMKVISNLASAARKRAEFRRTLAELNGLPQGIKRDLDIDTYRAVALARQAVYG